LSFVSLHVTDTFSLFDTCFLTNFKSVIGLGTGTVPVSDLFFIFLDFFTVTGG
jgi:hypothetical protein